MKKTLLIIVISLFLLSCDYLNTYNIENKTNENLIIEVSFNENYIDKKNVQKSLKFNLSNQKNLYLDTINYKIKLELEPNERYNLGFGINREPKLDYTKEINIYKNDSLVFYGNQYIIQNLYNNSNKNHTEIIYIY